MGNMMANNEMIEFIAMPCLIKTHLIEIIIV